MSLLTLRNIRRGRRIQSGFTRYSVILFQLILKRLGSQNRASLTLECPLINILLIDDDTIEKKILEIHLKKAGYRNVKVSHAIKCSKALQHLMQTKFDIILLDNRLSNAITADVTVPIIKGYLHGVPLVIISNDTDQPHLQSPEILGVDYIVNKSDLMGFMHKMLPVFPGFSAAS